MSKTLAPYLTKVRAELERALSAMEGTNANQINNAKDSMLKHPSKHPSQVVDRGNTQPSYPVRPHVEMGQITSTKLIPRNDREKCLIEGSRNSVRCSFQLKYQTLQQPGGKQPPRDTISITSAFSTSSATSSMELIEQTICSSYLRFFKRHAEDYHILRRNPLCIRNKTKERPDSEEAMGVDGEEGDRYAISFLILNSHVELYGEDQIVELILSFLSHLDREISEVKISLNARARLVASEFMKEF